MKKLCIIALSISYAVSAQAGSLSSEEIEQLKKYCEPDVERLCPDVSYGDGAVKACLKKNKEELSVGCAEALKKLKN
ncbi:MAG: cysteine rich repeat-containing protein [Rhodobacteraceae bacterium]|nr:cysteine rich repeat-containing protein [Paracoccaceae bacterium]